MKKYIILLLKFILSAAILVFLFNKIPLMEIGNSLQSAELHLIVIGLIITGFFIYLSAFETGYLTQVQGIIISTLQIVKIHLVTNFYGLFLPGAISGGAVKWYKLTKFSGKSDAAAVVVFNRFLEIFMLVFTGIIFSLPVLINIGETQLIIIWLIILSVLITSYYLILNAKALRFFERIVLSFPINEFIKRYVLRFFTSMHRFRNLTLKDNLEILVLLFSYHSLAIIIYYLFAISLNINISFFDIAWIRSVIGILTLVPISFAGLGVREGSLVYLFNSYGIPPHSAMAFSFLLFFKTIFMSISGGVIELHDFLSKKKNLIKEEEYQEKVAG
jgi:uncharacterized protein (TIRG00374 family)